MKAVGYNANVLQRCIRERIAILKHVKLKTIDLTTGRSIDGESDLER